MQPLAKLEHWRAKGYLKIVGGYALRALPATRTRVVRGYRVADYIKERSYSFIMASMVE
jgi:hypothetical protein